MIVSIKRVIGNKKLLISLYLELTIDFDQTVMTVGEDVGNVILSVTTVGKTTLPITVHIEFFGSSSENEGSFCFMQD